MLLAAVGLLALDLEPMASKRTPRDPAEPHWVDKLIKTLPPLPTAPPIDSEQAEASPLPPRPARPPLSDPLDPPGRYLDLLASLTITDSRKEKKSTRGRLEDLLLERQGKPLCRLVGASNERGQVRYARAKRPLSRREEDALFHAFVVGQELAIAQAVLLSNLSTEAERASALEYTEKIRDAARGHRAHTTRWLTLADQLEAIAPTWDGSMNIGLRVVLLLAMGVTGDALKAPVSDGDLSALVSAWGRPGRGRAKWGPFIAFCRAHDIEAPESEEAAKKAYQRHRAEAQPKNKGGTLRCPLQRSRGGRHAAFRLLKGQAS